VKVAAIDGILKLPIQDTILTPNLVDSDKLCMDVSDSNGVGIAR
jgi:hypothetical protein